MLTWTKTNGSPLVLEAQGVPARISRQVLGFDVTWVAQVDLPDATCMSFHHSPQAALAWCERQLATARN